MFKSASLQGEILRRDDGCRIVAENVLVPEGLVDSALEVLTNRTEYCKENYEGYVITSNGAASNRPPSTAQSRNQNVVTPFEEKEPLV